MEIWLLVPIYFFLGVAVLGLEFAVAQDVSDRTVVAIWAVIGLVVTAIGGIRLEGGPLPAAAYLVSLPAFWLPVRYLNERQAKANRSPEQRIPARAKELCAAVSDAVRRAPIAAEQKSAILEQIAAVRRNIKTGMDKLGRLHKLQELNIQLMGTEDPQVGEMAADLLAAMNAALELLLNISKSLMIVEAARDERTVARMQAALVETNRRMLDLAEAHAEVSRPERDLSDDAHDKPVSAKGARKH